MNTKGFFTCGGGSNLILGTGMENQIVFLRTPAAIKFFTKFSKIVTDVKTKSLPIQMDLYDPHMDPYTIPWGYYNFPRSTNKIC